MIFLNPTHVNSERFGRKGLELHMMTYTNEENKNCLAILVLYAVSLTIKMHFPMMSFLS